MEESSKLDGQVSEVTQSQIRLGVIQEQLARVVARREFAETENVKFKVVLESLMGSEKILEQRQKALSTAEPKVAEVILKGFDEALEMMKGLQQQARDGLAKAEGHTQACKQFEEELKLEVTNVTSRIQALESQGAKSVEVTQRAKETVSTNGSSVALPVFAALEGLGGATKEPIGSSEKETEN